eukprot:GILI01018552.1.p1 GENE.GILI01018552.1~~GILI01018552.1.p1  ORF type:complete len:733 (+),score=178.82 GILI01018552.1:188-2386(+)
MPGSNLSQYEPVGSDTNSEVGSLGSLDEASAFQRRRRVFSYLHVAGAVVVVGLVGVFAALAGYSVGRNSDTLAKASFPKLDLNAVPYHPQNPLSPNEIDLTISLLNTEPLFYPVGNRSRVHYLGLHEPTKDQVRQFIANPSLRFSRESFVILRAARTEGPPLTYEVVVDLSEKRLHEFRAVPNVQPSITKTEAETCAGKVLTDPHFLAAIEKRGLESKWVDIDYNSPGFYEDRNATGVDYSTTRLVRFEFYYENETENYWAVQIAGLSVLAELDSCTFHVYDSGAVPLPPSPFSRIDAKGQPKLRPALNKIDFHQPQGPSFTLDGYKLKWAQWEAHVKLDQRVGVMLSNVRYLDSTREGKEEMREVMYQGYMSEMWVPYMEPTPEWYYKNYFDVGEYGIGLVSSQLSKGVNCPSNAVFLDAVLADVFGRKMAFPDAICIFERYTGDVTWRHTDDEFAESRKEVELVIRHIPVVSNYDYNIDAIFKLDGTIRWRVGATGMDAMKAVTAATATKAAELKQDAHGGIIAPHVLAPYHDHYFNFRLDLDVDGPSNSFVKEKLVTKRLPEGHPRRSVWTVEKETLRKEGDALLNINLEKPSVWKVVNEDKATAIGNVVGYQIAPEGNVMPLLDKDDLPQVRGAFTNYHLWVTPYSRRERYAAGIYPNEAVREDGLPHWTKQNRNIEKTDIVAWYTMGFHHVTRQEDFPILCTHWGSFSITPYNFFERNANLNLPDDL